MAALDVELLPALSDNYIFMLHDPETATTGVVDPGEAAPVLRYLERTGRRLDWILCTHHHADHIGGNDELRAHFPAKIAAPAADSHRIENVDVPLKEGDVWEFGCHLGKVFETPGHTLGHISVWFEKANTLFCGDTLFALGCGRVFEGTFEQMHESLEKLMTIPDETTIYCGHEYTQSNARFALSVDGENQALAKYAARIDEARRRNQPTVPTTMAIERATNPFLRTRDPSIRAHLALTDGSNAEVFAELRRRKDHF